MRTPSRTRSATPADGQAEPSTSEAAAALRLAVARLARVLRQQAEPGLTLSQLSALSTVERAGPLSLGALADEEGVTAPTITRIVAKLDEDGLVARTHDPGDRRSTRVAITPAGRALLRARRRQRTAWLVARMDELTPADRARLLDALPVLQALAQVEREAPR